MVPPKIYQMNTSDNDIYIYIHHNITYYIYIRIYTYYIYIYMCIYMYIINNKIGKSLVRPLRIVLLMIC